METRTLLAGSPLIGEVNFSERFAGEGLPLTVSGRFTDSDLGTSGETFAVSIDWGNGASSVAAVDNALGTFTGNYTYENIPEGGGLFDVTVTVIDSEGGTDSEQKGLRVESAPLGQVPRIGPISITAPNLVERTPIHFDTVVYNSGSATVVRIDWGDGESSLVVDDLPGSSWDGYSHWHSIYEAEHTYIASGVYEVTVSLIDDGNSIGTEFLAWYVGQNYATVVTTDQSVTISGRIANLHFPVTNQYYFKEICSFVSVWWDFTFVASPFSISTYDHISSTAVQPDGSFSVEFTYADLLSITEQGSIPLDADFPSLVQIDDVAFPVFYSASDQFSLNSPGLRNWSDASLLTSPTIIARSVTLSAISNSNAEQYQTTTSATGDGTGGSSSDGYGIGGGASIPDVIESPLFVINSASSSQFTINSRFLAGTDRLVSLRLLNSTELLDLVSDARRGRVSLAADTSGGGSERQGEAASIDYEDERDDAGADELHRKVVEVVFEQFGTSITKEDNSDDSAYETNSNEQPSNKRPAKNSERAGPSRDEAANDHQQRSEKYDTAAFESGNSPQADGATSDSASTSDDHRESVENGRQPSHEPAAG